MPMASRSARAVSGSLQRVRRSSPGWLARRTSAAPWPDVSHALDRRLMKLNRLFEFRYSRFVPVLIGDQCVGQHGTCLDVDQRITNLVGIEFAQPAKMVAADTEFFGSRRILLPAI